MGGGRDGWVGEGVRKRWMDRWGMGKGQMMDGEAELGRWAMYTYLYIGL